MKKLSAVIGVTNPEPLQDWIDRVSAIPELTEAVAGIYCGRDGSIREAVDSKHFLVMGWHENRVEYAYIS